LATCTWRAGSALNGATLSAARLWSRTPPGVDYDLWLGPAPKRAFTKNRFPLQLALVLGTTATAIWGNQGIHELDIARWGLGVTYPTKVSAIGGHFMFDDDQETPNTIMANYDSTMAARRR